MDFDRQGHVFPAGEQPLLEWNPRLEAVDQWSSSQTYKTPAGFRACCHLAVNLQSNSNGPAASPRRKRPPNLHSPAAQTQPLFRLCCAQTFRMTDAQTPATESPFGGGKNTHPALLVRRKPARALHSLDHFTGRVPLWDGAASTSSCDKAATERRRFSTLSKPGINPRFFHSISQAYEEGYVNGDF
ncbi:hypothetical protein D4764_08G0008650 [Takifugu flavidus]|uniref:Uncharacterized protein n=1 Tax=Takifugu flavidus TaxID=433684 RepID=A0A5C6MRA0_9TELE|nr:hypothetical protein D4764_08G0008650 [Takifugu flavidus]